MAPLFQGFFPSRHVRVLATASGLAMLLYLFPDTARSQTGVCSEQPSPVAASTDSTDQQQLKAFIDPATGELISQPPAADAAAAPVKVADQPELPVEVWPDGTLVLDLTDNPVNELRVEKVDGKLIECHREVGAGSAKSAASQHDHGADRPAGSDQDEER